MVKLWKLAAANQALVSLVNLNCVAFGMLNNKLFTDLIHAEILELRKEFGHLSNSFHSDRQSLQIMIINQKDDKISRLKTTVQELRQANENLMTD